MYPKKQSPLSSQAKRELEKSNRREQLKNLIVNKFRSKYSVGIADPQERDNIIMREVDKFMENEKCTEKNLIELDKKLTEKFGAPVTQKQSQPRGSRQHSHASRGSNKMGSQMSNRSAMIRAGLDISSQDRGMDSSYSKNRNNLSGIHRTNNLNRSHLSPKPGNEWDSIVMLDVKKYEEEQKQSLLKKQQMKRKVMEDLNAQMQEKRMLQRREAEREKSFDQQIEKISKKQDLTRRQQELRKSKKYEEERKIMENQIAEIEKIKQFERDKEKGIARKEKKEVDKALEDELNRELRKKREYQEVCQKQYQENMHLKEFLKQQELQRQKEESIRKRDMFGDMFEEKKHVSYELAAKNQRKFDALNKILNEENERKNRVKNYAEFEQGVNSIDRKQVLSEQLKENRLRENLRVNKTYLEEQIKFKHQQDKFEREREKNEARLMNMKAKEELDKESKRHHADRLKKIQYKDELKTQMNFKNDPYENMTEQERRMNRDMLDNAE